MPRFPTSVAAVAIAAAVAVCAHDALAQAAWYEGFDGPEPSWQPAGGDAAAEIRVHRRDRTAGRTESGCEYLQVVGSGGTHFYVSHDIGRARVIDELIPSVQIKADRPGVEIFARVVLPRSRDPRTGGPVTALIHGSSYNAVGRWQQLRITDIPRELTRQTRILRAQFGPQIDDREAYVDQILLNVFGGPGATSVWIDDLDIGGYVEPPPAKAGTRTASSSTGGDGPIRLPPTDRSSTTTAVEPVRLAGSVLLCGQRPVFPRAIRHNGEPLVVLRQLGFNAVWTARPPAPGMLEEARRLGLWVVCPPPTPSQIAAASGADRPRIGPAYDGVLAWDLGRDLPAELLEATRHRADWVRQADSQPGRPLVCAPSGDLRGYSRLGDQSMVLLIGRSPLGTSLELGDYATWIRQRPRLARPGTPFWTTVQTQPAVELVEQLRAIDPSRPAPDALPPEQVRLAVYTAITSGSRGLLFESHAPLDAEDPDTRQRAMTLELLNLELELVEPWVAGGQFVTAVAGSEPELTGAVLRSDRARLLVALWSAPGGQFASGQSAAAKVTFTVPGVPDQYRPYLLTPGALKPLFRERQPGGMRITVEEFGLTSAVLFALDPLTIDNLARRAARIGRRAAELRRGLAARKIQNAADALEAIYHAATPDKQAVARLDDARQDLQWCDGYLAARNEQAAYLHAARAMRAVRLVERNRWETATGPLPSPVSTPAAAFFRTLPWHVELVGRINGSQLGPNRLAGGDFEDLGVMLQGGWVNIPHPAEGIRTQAELARSAARQGSFGLRLAAWSDDKEAPGTLIETPPIRITTPDMPVEAGSLVVIRGWVQVPSPVTGSVDGLLIHDSLGGQPLADRIGQTDGWHEFTLYRLAPRSGPLQLTFTLTGLGEAWIDDVTVHTLTAPRMAAR